MIKVISKKIASSHPWLVCPSRENHNSFTIGSNLELSIHNSKKSLALISTLSATLQFLAKEIVNLKFVQDVNFELMDSLENNGTEYLFMFGE